MFNSKRTHRVLSYEPTFRANNSTHIHNNCHLLFFSHIDSSTLLPIANHIPNKTILYYTRVVKCTVQHDDNDNENDDKLPHWSVCNVFAFERNERATLIHMRTQLYETFCTITDCCYYNACVHYDCVYCGNEPIFSESIFMCVYVLMCT